MKPGSGVLPPAVMAAWSGMSAAARDAAVALSNYMDHSGECWPSQAALARAVGAGERTVRRGVRGLVDAGLLEVRRRRRGSAIYSWAAPAEAIQDRPTVAGQEPSKTGHPWPVKKSRPAKSDRQDRPTVAGLLIEHPKETGKKRASPPESTLLAEWPGGPEAELAWGNSYIRRDLWRAGIRRGGDLLRMLGRIAHRTGVRPRAETVMAFVVQFSRRPWTADGQRILHPAWYAEEILMKDPRAVPRTTTERLVADAHKLRGRRRGDPNGRTHDDRHPRPPTVGELARRVMDREEAQSG